MECCTIVNNPDNLKLCDGWKFPVLRNMERYTVVDPMKDEPRVIKAYDEIEKRFVIIKKCRQNELDNHIKMAEFKEFDFFPKLYDHWKRPGDKGVIVMEFIEGEEFADWRRRWLSEGSRPFMPAWKFLGSLLTNISKLHAAGFSFGDLNESNVIWTGETVKLVDLEGIRPVDLTDNELYVGELGDLQEIGWKIGFMIDPSYSAENDSDDDNNYDSDDVRDHESHPHESEALIQMYNMLYPILDPECRLRKIVGGKQIPTVHELLKIYNSY